MGRRRTIAILLGVTGAAAALVHRGRGHELGRRAPGGVLMGDAVGYDTLSSTSPSASNSLAPTTHPISWIGRMPGADAGTMTTSWVAGL
jgi:hypothetical protein